MHILIISATYLEVKSLITHFNAKKENDRFFSFATDKNFFDILITGVGMTATAFYLTDALSQKNYDFVLNLGICGSFKSDYPIGQVVSVGEQICGDLGVEDGQDFLPFSNQFLPESEQDFNRFVFKNESKKFENHLAIVKSISVNRVHGNEESIKQIVELFNPDVESMEGIAVFLVCINKEIPFMEVRAVSNKVEKRNRDNWNIPLAIQSLTEEVIQLCHTFSKE